MVAKRSIAAKRSSASPNETSVAGNGTIADRIFWRASSSLITREYSIRYPQSAICISQVGIEKFSVIFSRDRLVRWLSGRKQRFAKAPYPKRVPRVRIPPSPPLPPTRQQAPACDREPYCQRVPSTGSLHYSRQLATNSDLPRLESVRAFVYAQRD